MAKKKPPVAPKEDEVKLPYSVPETHKHTGDLHTDLLGYVKEHPMSHAENINLPYTQEQIKAGIVHLKGTAKLQSDGHRIWM